ncbi:hypothetical protein Bca52824_050947 [Brassica carinata]|uniref:Uncharacterized protein n=1 Tax=Brassica carinata TaxID=52824 RepID=A0A8X7R150_BRACI|nr:hypothetical protein Bca52824_050947 [Brassica carinata]
MLVVFYILLPGKESLKTTSLRRGLPDKLELQRTSRGHLDRSRKSPPKHTKEWRPIRQGKDNTEAARVIETEMNDEERRRLKGKMIVQDPTRSIETNLGRGTLIIREPSSNPPENQTEGVQRSNLGGAIQNGASKKIVETEERHSPRGSEDLELIDPDSEEDGELMDDEAFDRMIEQYTEPEQMTEADIYNVDDLMEEEQDLERTRLAKEATPTTLEEEKSKSIEKSVQNVETTIRLPERGEKSAITSQKNDETEIFKNLDQEGHQIMAAKKKKKTPRSPDVKGTAASKKLAVRGRASPKGKASRHQGLVKSQMLTTRTRFQNLHPLLHPRPLTHLRSLPPRPEAHLLLETPLAITPQALPNAPHYHHVNASMQTLCALHGWTHRDTPRRVFDAVLFSNEVDMLTICWKELHPYVTQFVILESYSTFTGLPKPLVFAANREKFGFVEPRLTYGNVGGRFKRGENPFVEEA